MFDATLVAVMMVPTISLFLNVFVSNCFPSVIRVILIVRILVREMSLVNVDAHSERSLF